MLVVDMIIISDFCLIFIIWSTHSTDRNNNKSPGKVTAVFKEIRGEKNPQNCYFPGPNNE